MVVVYTYLLGEKRMEWEEGGWSPFRGGEKNNAGFSVKGWERRLMSGVVVMTDDEELYLDNGRRDVRSCAARRALLGGVENILCRPAD